MKNKTNKIKAQPKPVERVVCPKCGELQMKVYPYSSYRRMDNKPIMPCQKCLAKEVAKKS